MINTSELDVEIWPARLEDGKTFQDLLDKQSEPGEYVPRPDWAVQSFKFSSDRQVWTINLDKAGEYAIGVGGYNPDSLWFCAPLIKVIDN